MEREREGVEEERERNTDRQIHRQTDRQTEAAKDVQRELHFLFNTKPVLKVTRTSGLNTSSNHK